MTTDSAAEEPLVSVSTTGAIARITVGSGAKRNALTGQGWSDLERVVREIDRDGSTAVVHVRGRDETFCAGSDMREWVNADLDRVEESFTRMESAFRAIEECSVPVVAEIHGVAAGAGCQLALACDLRLMAESARIGMPIARLGIKPSPAFAARMIALAGPARTRRMLYTGVLLDARAAVTAGLADERVPDAELPDAATRLVSEIAEQPLDALRAAKHAVSAALEPVRQATRHNDQEAVSPVEFQRAVSTFLR